MSAKVTQELFDFVNQRELPDSQLQRRLESLQVSADAKALLGDLLELATKVGDATLRIGRKVLDFVLSMLNHFPKLSFAILLAGVLSALVAAVPLLGALLSPFVTPLLLALGVAFGGLTELSDPTLNARVQAFTSKFQAIA